MTRAHQSVARVLSDVVVRGQDGEPVGLSERDDHAIEGIAVERRQCGRRARHRGVKGDFPQSVPFDHSREPPGGRLLESELASSDLIGPFVLGQRLGRVVPWRELYA